MRATCSMLPRARLSAPPHSSPRRAAPTPTTPSLLLKKPTGHGVHSVLPVNGAYVPLGQPMQEVLPAPVLNVFTCAQ